MKNETRQPSAVAIRIDTRGATVMPNTDPNRFCTMPLFRPRRLAGAVAATMARQIGRNGPSTRPMSMREARSDQKPCARPDSTEQAENTSIAPSRNGFLTPFLSDHRPNT